MSQLRYRDPQAGIPSRRCAIALAVALALLTAVAAWTSAAAGFVSLPAVQESTATITATPILIQGPAPTTTATGTPTNTPISTQVVTATLTATRTATAGPSPTRASTASPTATVTTSPTPTASPTPTVTVSPTPTVSPTATAGPTAEPTATATTAPTEVPLPSPTVPLSPTAVPPGPPSVRNTDLLLVGGGVLALGVALLALFLLILRRKPPAAGTIAEPRPSPAGPKGPPPGGASAPPPPLTLFTPVRPHPGIPYLESQNRPGGVLYCPLTKPVVAIGRGAENDLVIDDSFHGWQTVSRRHATVEYNGTRALVVDQGAANGVYIHGQRTGTNVLQDGWTVGFGQVEFTYRVNRGGGAQ